MLSWEGVREFIAVVETDSFTVAAKQLGTSVAQVSRRIGTLEDRLGAKLFYRTTRKVSVTETGSTYYHHCRPAIESLEEAERAISDLQLRPKGNLRLSAPVAYGEKAIMPLLNEFMKLYADINIDVLLTNKKVDLIEDGFDLAIRLGVLESSSLIAKKLSSRTLYVCASPDYISKYGQPFTLSELGNHNCLLGTLDHWRFVENSQEKNMRVKGNYRCNSGPSLLNATLDGLGLAQLADYYVEPYIKSAKIIPILESYRPPEEGVWAVHPSNRYLSSKVRALIDFLDQHLP